MEGDPKRESESVWAGWRAAGPCTGKLRNMEVLRMPWAQAALIQMLLPEIIKAFLYSYPYCILYNKQEGFFLMFWIGVWHACKPLINKNRQVSQPGFYYLLPISRFQLPT